MSLITAISKTSSFEARQCLESLETSVRSPSVCEPNRGTGRRMTRQGENVSQPLVFSDNDAFSLSNKILNREQSKQLLRVLLKKFEAGELAELPETEYEDDS